jgi:hypothetical protein
MTPIQEQILRSALFVPCDSKEDLHRWIKIYLGMDLPNTIVCDDERHHPPSNSSPMDLVWEIYQKARLGLDPDFQEILAYAARESGKTVSASIIEILCIIHLGRDVVHLAAIEPQAKYCLDYVRKFLSRPILKEFVTSTNRRGLKFSKYISDKDPNVVISPVQWESLDPETKKTFSESKNEIFLTVATVEACNGLHAPFMCVTGDSRVILENLGPVPIEDVIADSIGGKASLVGEFKVEPTKKFKILSWHPELEKFEFREIKKVFRRKATDVIKVKFSMTSWGSEKKTFSTIACTKDHQFYCVPPKTSSVKGFWIPARELKPGFELFSVFDKCKIESVTKTENTDWVYDVEIEETHNFVCEDVVIHNCMDELDLVDPAAFMEAKSIPTSTVDRKYPITFMTSTRKYSYGLVQKEIDRASTEDTRLNIRHWNLIDITESCPPQRHLPEEPKIEIFVNEEYLKALSREEYETLSDKEKQGYESYDGYAGCLSNCKMFAACKGRLATKQTSQSPMLKRIDHTQSNIRKVSLEHAKAQYLCWKPSTAGLVFPHFDKEKHVITAAEMAKLATGDDFDKNFSKADLIKLFKDLDAEFYSGIDWGFSHNYVVVTAAMLGHILYVIDVIVGGELLLPDKIDITKKRIGYLSPTVFPDNAYPADIRSFRLAGFKMIDFRKDVLEGITAVSERLYSMQDKNPTIWFLKDDPGVDFLTKEISLYHWKLDKAGNLLDEPDKVDDDSVDALRYLCQNLQIGKSRFVKIAKEQETQRKPTMLQTFVKDKIKELTRDEVEEMPQLKGGPGFKFII